MRPFVRIAAPFLIAVGLGCDNNKQVVIVTAPTVAATPAPTPAPANRPPTASIADWQPRSIAVVGGTHVGFGAKASDPDGDRLTYAWDFGDGETDSGEALFHIFNKEGDFTVRLTVRDGRGGEASDEVAVRARRITGNWTLNNAMHFPLTAKITQYPDSSFIQGVVSDHSTFEGNLLDPYGIRIEYNSQDFRCISTGTYEGSIYSGLNQIVFAGSGCNNFSFVR